MPPCIGCDVLLMLGTDFPYKQFFPTGISIAQVDLRPENLGRRCKLDLGIVGDVGDTIAALLPKLKPKTDRQVSRRQPRALQGRACRTRRSRRAASPAESRSIRNTWRSLLSEQAERGRGVHRRRRHADDLGRALSEDERPPPAWSARWVHGSMANAMAQAIGVQAAQPGRQVMSMSGDGGFAMLMGDLITLTQAKLPVKVVIFNNSVLGFVAAGDEGGWLHRDRGRPEESGFRGDGPRHGHSRASGSRIPASSRRDPRRYSRMTARPCSTSSTATQELSMPPTITLEQVKGFSLWVLRAVMSGRGDEVVDLAKTNLLPR